MALGALAEEVVPYLGEVGISTATKVSAEEEHHYLVLDANNNKFEASCEPSMTMEELLRRGKNLSISSCRSELSRDSLPFDYDRQRRKFTHDDRHRTYKNS